MPGWGWGEFSICHPLPCATIGPGKSLLTEADGAPFDATGPANAAQCTVLNDVGVGGQLRLLGVATQGWGLTTCTIGSELSGPNVTLAKAK